MKKKILILVIGLLLIGTDIYAGNLTVSGNVGIGTTSPGTKLDVYGSGDNIIAATGPQNNTTIIGHNGTRGVIRTTYWGSPGGFTPLTLQTSNIDRIYISTDGNVGIGTTSPYSKMSFGFGAIDGSQRIALYEYTNSQNFYGIGMIHPDGNYGVGIWANKTFAQTNPDVYIQNGGAVGLQTTNPSYTLHVNGNAYSAGGWSGSDIRWKKNIIPLENSLDNILKLQGVNYEWRVEEYKDKNFKEGKQIGLIAQEVEKIIPELVHTDNEGYKALSYEKLTAVLVEAIKEQQKEIEQYKNKQHEFEDRIKRLEEGNK